MGEPNRNPLIMEVRAYTLSDRQPKVLIVNTTTIEHQIMFLSQYCQPGVVTIAPCNSGIEMAHTFCFDLELRFRQREYARTLELKSAMGAVAKIPFSRAQIILRPNGDINYKLIKIGPKGNNSYAIVSKYTPPSLQMLGLAHAIASPFQITMRDPAQVPQSHLEKAGKLNRLVMILRKWYTDQLDLSPHFFSCSHHCLHNYRHYRPGGRFANENRF